MAEEKNRRVGVKTDVFEGPLDLLLSLVEKRKLFINDIALATVAHEYAETVRGNDNGFPLEEASQFLVIAATLLLIKSRSLLPNLILTEEEEAGIADLSERLHVYDRYREMARGLAAIVSPPLLTQLHPPKQQRIKMAFSPGTTTASVLEGSLEAVISRLPKKPFLRTAAVEKTIRIEEMMSALAERVQTSLRLTWNELHSFKGERSPHEMKVAKVEAIVSFLAILELVKRGAILALQTAHFSDICLESREIGVPRYG